MTASNHMCRSIWSYPCTPTHTGTWADKHVAVSGTGIGEEFIRGATAHDVAARRAYKGISTKDAVCEVVHGVMRPGDGGVVE